MNFAHFCEFWCFSLGKQARSTLNFCSGTPLRKVHELTFLWFSFPGPLLSKVRIKPGLVPGTNPVCPWDNPEVVPRATAWKIQRTEEKGLFPQISSDILRFAYHSPRNFYKLIPLPYFFFVFFFVIFTGIRCGHRFFFVTPMRSSGSRVDWKIFFVSFTKLIPRKIFFVLQKFWCWW